MLCQTIILQQQGSELFVFIIHFPKTDLHLIAQFRVCFGFLQNTKVTEKVTPAFNLSMAESALYKLSVDLEYHRNAN